MTDSDAPDGIDQHRVGAWLTERVPDLAPPFRYELIIGGRSNLTYCVTDANGRRCVLRRPPLGHLLATAHDVAREYRIVEALGPTPVPVPRALAVCEDPEVNGAPFAVTEFVDGVVLDVPEKAAQLDAASLRAISCHLMDVLADLHAVDLEAAGLSGLSRHDSYIERQVARWSKQWAGSRTRELPLIDDVEARLRGAIPRQQGVTIVHGDYRFGNCITDVGRGEIAAVLDWELCTLGDPLADLGHMGIYWHDAADPLPLTNDPTSGGAFPPFGELLRRYAARTGRDVSQMGYYRAFAAWRLAIIAEGVASRHRERHPEDDGALALSQQAVQRLAEYALASLNAPAA
ncbi:MAG: phosphotransferase family protein [Chloroflexota bacterium]|nr:phosphotransferase family protein [Chloroflexota bacterium]